MKKLCYFVFAVLALGFVLMSARIATEKNSPVQAASPPIDYSRDILPILSSKCFTCHGPASNARKGGVRLDQRAAALMPARSGSIPIKPGDAAASEVVRRLFCADEEERMPPAKGGKPLSEYEKSLIKLWIEQGAEYQLHWAFVRPQSPPLPRVKQTGWAHNEIDLFILAGLEQEGLTPSAPADRATLIRRLSLDLRGLPPSLTEVDAFLADRSANAYEKLVDQMLASPHYGEKMAQTWLDLARFGDTSGYHFDSKRQMWPWRDWVINAYNQNMPFDQFTIEQLAGDLLPGATLPQKIASGFHRNTRFNEEGGVDPEEYVIRYTVDRTNTLGQVWLGLTLGCAECHSHKYDPISHKEYYQLYAYFTGIAEPMKSGNHGEPLLPLLQLPTPAQTQTLTAHRAQLAVVENAIAKEIEHFPYVDPPQKPKKPGGAALPLQSQSAWENQTDAHEKLPAPVKAALKVARNQRDAQQQKILRDYYLRTVFAGTRENLAPLLEDVEELTQKIKALEEAIPHTLITEELPAPRSAYVLIRGDFQHKGEKVERGVPAIFPPLSAAAPNNRLGLARWLVRPDHPLTARVTVNRLWAQMFGQGLVPNLGDFGTQAEQPSHPALLDWLAYEFVRQGWDVKALLRKLALSASYQQSSTWTSLAKVDPSNRWYARASRHRLSAEELRDSALAISGLLNTKVGGPSFMPYQPPDFYKGKNEDWTWKPSEGEDQYRRGIYAFWRRNALHPMFAVFDAPARDECTVSRPRTNTPLQALVTLNDPTFVEAARVFAQKILMQGPQDFEGRLAYAFRSATCRLPSAAEMKVLRERYQQQERRFRADEDAASKLVNVGQSPRDAALNVSEHAAWTALANLLLNLDEVLNRE